MLFWRIQYHTNHSMKLLCVLILLVSTLTASDAQGQSFRDKAEMYRLSERVADLFRQNKVDEAFAAIEPYWPISEAEFGSVKEKTHEYMDIYHERFAPASVITRVREQTIGDFAIRETWCVLFRNTAIRLIFTWYKNPDGWVLNGFNWNDSFEEEFK